MDLSVRSYPTGLAAASTMIVALSLTLAPPPALHGVSSQIEARVVQLDAAVTAQVPPVAAGVRPASAAAISAAGAVTPTTNPLTSVAQGLQSLTQQLRSFVVGVVGEIAFISFLGFIAVYDVLFLPLLGPDGQLPSWVVQLESWVAKVVQGVAAVLPVNAASSVVKPNNPGMQADSAKPKHVADTPIVATPALLAAGAGHPKNTATVAVPTTKKTAAPAAATGQGRSGRK